MIGVYTNVLACCYIDDAGDVEARRQREAARRLIESGKTLMVCKTVLPELEWVMRGYYRFTPGQIAGALHDLLDFPHVQVEDRESVVDALSHYGKGLYFADAMHHAAYRQCKAMSSFDDRRFARGAKRLGLIPTVVVPAYLAASGAVGAAERVSEYI